MIRRFYKTCPKEEGVTIDVEKHVQGLFVASNEMEVEPVLDRDARIEARRARIKERLGAQKGEGENIGKDGKVIEEESRSKAQISDSRARIDKLKTTGASEVTKVRIIGDSRENERRINEEGSRQGRRQKLLYEAESSARQNAAVAM